MLPLPLHPELGGEEGHYQTVWRRSTAVNEFGMALFVPKPEPSSAHGGSGRHTIKIDHDPPSPVAVRFEPEKSLCSGFRRAGSNFWVSVHGWFANCGSRTVSVCKRCENKLGS